jgi:beta-glucosidase/6-phospho-beta-glucosidase/beta-galactosidase
MAGEFSLNQILDKHQVLIQVSRCDNWQDSCKYLLSNKFYFDTNHNLIRFMEPLTKGDYPISMRTLVGNRLPRFTKEQSKAINGSFDFIGLNYYTARYAQNVKHNIIGNISYNTDSLTNQTGNHISSISKFISVLYSICMSELRVFSTCKSSGKKWGSYWSKGMTF